MIHFKPLGFGKSEKLLLLALALLTLFMIGAAFIPGVREWYEHSTTAWTSWAIRYGYWGSFLAALVSNASVLIVLPYTIVTVFLAASGLHPLALGVITGLGASIGELVSYGVGRFGSRWFRRSRPESYMALDQVVESRPHIVQWMLFIVGLLPIPDDLLLVPLGMLRFPLRKIIVASMSGKIIATVLITYTASLVSELTFRHQAASATSMAGELATLYTIVLLIYGLMKLDWERMLHRWLNHPAFNGKQENIL